MLVAQSCPTLWDHRDCSLPGSSVHGILQARILDWAVIPFSQFSSQLRRWTQVSCIAGRFFIMWTSRKLIITQSPSSRKWTPFNRVDFMACKLGLNLKNTLLKTFRHKFLEGTKQERTWSRAVFALGSLIPVWPRVAWTEGQPGQSC